MSEAPTPKAIQAGNGPSQDERGSHATDLVTTRPRRRYVKVDVPEDVFLHLHDMANESRMRFLPYLRRFLQEAWPYRNPSESADGIPFGTTAAADSPEARPT